MNLLKLIAAATLLTSTGAAFAADADATSKTPDTPLLLAKASPAETQVRISDTKRAGGTRGRAEVHAEAVQAAKDHRATLAESLDFYKN